MQERLIDQSIYCLEIKYIIGRHQSQTTVNTRSCINRQIILEKMHELKKVIDVLSFINTPSSINIYEEMATNMDDVLMRTTRINSFKSDVILVESQGGVNLERAYMGLLNNDFDIVNSIMALTH